MPLLLALAATSAAVSPPCRGPHTVPVDQKARPRSLIHHLGDEPPADQIVAVLRMAGPCPTPIVLRHDIGMPRKAER